MIDHPVIALDLHPTIVAAAGGEAPKGLDGVNLLPLARGDSQTAPHEALYWRFGALRAIRKGDWKMTQSGSSEPELYNLASDIGEQTNLAASQPEKLKELLADWNVWNGQLMAPRWGRADRGRNKAGKKKRNSRKD